MQSAVALAWRRTVSRPLALLACASLATATAPAQTPPTADPSAVPAAPASQGREIPKPGDLEPAVTTTPASGPEPGAAPPAATPAAKPAATPPGAAGASTPAGTRKGAPARLELEATEITGNRELPKVLYIVPWKRSDLGDLVGRPVNSLLDEVLQPLDRDVFRRENRYYQALKPDQNPPKTGAAPGSEAKP